MTMKCIIAVALVVPFMTVSSMAQTVERHVYQGAPKTTVPHATRPTTTAREAFGMLPPAAVPRVKRSHIYNGGPQTVVPHSY
jgi:hypothetical protein